ncbi:MAG: PAS domain S-box protein, partial [Cyanobacteria bacterium P01_A01_bin.135]
MKVSLNVPIFGRNYSACEDLCQYWSTASNRVTWQAVPLEPEPMAIALETAEAIAVVVDDHGVEDLRNLQAIQAATDQAARPIVVLTGPSSSTAAEALSTGDQLCLPSEDLTPEIAAQLFSGLIERHQQAQQVKALQESFAREKARHYKVERSFEEDFQSHMEELEAEIIRRHRIERQLHHQVANLEIIFRAFPDAIIFLDSNRRIRKVSSALGRLFGYQSAEILGQTMDVLHHNPDDCRLLKEQRFSVFAEETFEPYNIHYQRQDGSTFIGETIGTIVKDEAGHILGFLGIIRDVTEHNQLMQERDRAQAELACHKAQLQQFVTHMPVAVAMFDTQMHHLFHSDRWLEDHGLSGVDITGKNHYELFPDIPDFWRSRHQQCLSGQVLRQDEEVAIQDDGTSEWIKWELRPWYTASGEIGGALLLTEVITARKNAQLRLEASEARFRTFMDNSLAIAFMKNEAGEYLYVNKHFEQFCCLPQGELMAKTAAAWLPQGTAEGLAQHDAHVLATGEASQRLEMLPTADGRFTYWMVCKFPCFTATGKAIGGVAFNITEQKRIEQELFREKELAQVTLQSIGDAVITTDAQGNITYLNSAAERLTGWSLVEVIMQPLVKVFHTVDEMTRQRVPNPADLVLRGGQAADSKPMVLIARDSQEYSIVDSAAPIKDRDGTMVGVVLVFHDVTESRILSQQLVWQASHDTL